jgi:alkylation response protein AidB-like acyl-CoA dehydrogenase
MSTMQPDTPSDQELLRDGLIDLAQRHWNSEALEGHWGGDMQPEQRLRQALSEAGVLELTGGEEEGGMGQHLAELHALIETAGYHALPTWVVDHLVALPLVEQCGARIEPAGEGRAIFGLAFNADIVPHGPQVDAVLQWSDEGLQLHEGCAYEALETVDRGRPLHRLVGAASTRLLAQGTQAQSLRNAAFNASALVDSLQLLGLAQSALDRSVNYAQERRQFGKPIGAQQAIKHQLSDALIAIEFARPMVQRAAQAWHQNEPEREGRISGAWLMTTEAARRVERTAMQVHGAMGYSYEYPLHYLLKRSWALRRNRGPASVHRRRAAAWILEQPNHG